MGDTVSYRSFELSLEDKIIKLETVLEEMERMHLSAAFEGDLDAVNRSAATE